MATKIGENTLTREVEINGNRVNVSIDKEGIAFRLPGRRNDVFLPYETAVAKAVENSDDKAQNKLFNAVLAG